MALAAKANGPSGERYRKGVAEAIERELAPLPYAVIENDIKGAKASAELIGETLILGEAREVMQPIVDRSGSISSDFAPALVNARLAFAAMLPLKATLIDAFASYLQRTRLPRPISGRRATSSSSRHRRGRPSSSASGTAASTRGSLPIEWSRTATARR